MSPFLGLIAMVLLAATIGTWVILNADREERINEALRGETNAIAETLHHDLILRTRATKRMAGRLQRSANLPYADGFVQDAVSYITDMPGFWALSVFDDDFVARRVVPNTNTSALGRNIAEVSEDRRLALEAARDTRQTTMTNPVELVGGDGVGFLIFTPIFQHDEFSGILATVFRVNTWLDQFISDQTPVISAPDYTKITLNGVVLFEGESFGKVTAPALKSDPNTIFDQTFEVFTKRHPEFDALHDTKRPEIMTGFVAVLSLLILALVGNGLRLQQARSTANQNRQALQQANAALVTEVDVRQMAETKAKKADEAKSRFLAVMSHEIRTPLNAIMGMFELIERADVPDRQKRQAQSGHRAANRLFGELTKVLDVSRLDAGSLTIHKTTVDTQAVFDEWVTQLTAAIASSEKPIEIVTTLDPDVPRSLDIDFDRTTQILNNLIDNAVKFTETGQIGLRICLGDHGETIKVSVSDTGCGIASCDVAATFTRFYQLESAVKRSHQGSGLGLSICKDLAELMGGTIKVTSEVGKSSTFTLTLPLGTDATSPQAHSQNAG
ncbi:ATP-binding protein [Nereida sp. MMG025]|uniref:sensor histidine kinase n=1 Tax=Nereida sp. MMG025 TaxID=2909981 RepID=UPI001F26D803|nr:ATP-binding protein [Nereida sp. MMG025]MCF6445336.1 ATP-binding protein [Nereida sp. MMG025]